jgi:hypothetical protein
MRTIHRGKKRGINAKKKKGPNWFFSPNLALKRVSPPVLDLPYLLLTYSSLNQSLVRIKMLQIL